MKAFRGILLFIISLLIINNINAYADDTDLLSRKWVRLDIGGRKSVSVVLSMIGKTDIGSRLISEAQKKYGLKDSSDLANFISPGINSYTDSTLHRTVSMEDSKQAISFTSKVYIAETSNLLTASADLVHELTHFIFKLPVNPYASDFSYNKVLNSTIEGSGGEVDALTNECYFLFEMKVKYGAKIGNKCSTYVRNGRISKELIKKDFYKVGKYFDYLMKQPGDFVTSMSSEKPVFVSSVYKVPYPVSAFDEFKKMSNEACKNNCYLSKRLKKTSRGLASVSSVDNYLLEKCTVCK